LKRWGWVWFGLSVVLAELIPGGTVTARGANLARYISSDFCAALVISPERISQSTLAQAIKSGLPKEMASTDPVTAAVAALGSQKNLPPGIDVTKLAKLLQGKTVQHIVVFIDPMPTPTVPVSPGIIVRFGTDVDGNGILSALNADWQPAETEGTKYKKMKNPEAGQPDIAAVVPDSRTLIAGLEVTVVKMLAKDQGAQPFLKQLQNASLNNDICLEFLAKPLWTKITKATGKSTDNALAAMGNPMLAGLAKEIKSVSIKLNFSGKTLLHAEIATVKPEAAAMFSAIAQKSVADLKPKFEDMKKQPLPMMPPPLVPMISKLGDEVFEGLKIEAEGPLMKIDLAMPASLPDALKAASEMAAQTQTSEPSR